MNPLHLNILIRVFLLLAWVALFISPSALAQLSIEWDKTYGGQGWEELQTMTLSADGGYVFGGITTTRNPSSEVTQPTRDTVVWPEKEGDYWIVKTDGYGNPLWDRRYGGFKEDRLWSIQQTQDGGYLLGGESLSGIGGDKTKPGRGNMDFWVIKTDSHGNIQWDAAYGSTGSDTLRAIVPLTDGTFLLAGYSNSPQGFEKSENARLGSTDFWVVKIAADGTYLKDFTYGGSGEDRLFDAVLLPDGNVLLGGFSTSPISFDKQQPYYGVNDIWLVKIDLSGEILWEKTIGGSGEDVLQSIFTTMQGTILLLGQSSSPVSGNKTAPNIGNLDAWIIHVEDRDTAAAILWQKTYGGLAGDYAYSAAQNDAGYFMVLGVTASEVLPQGGRKDSFIGFNDFWVLFLDDSGEILWDETLGGVDYDSGVKVSRAHDYGFILGGHSSSNASPPYKSEPSRGLNDMWVIRAGCSFPGPGLQDIPRVCRHETIAVNASVSACPQCIYTWQDGDKNPLRFFSPDTTTQLSVTIIHPDGCSLSDTLTIEVVPAPEAVLTDSKPVSCYGKSDAMFSVEEVQGGTPPYLFSLDNGDWEDFALYANLPAGLYQLHLRDANDCPFDTTFFIAQPDEVIVELGEDIYLELGDSVQLQALTNLTDSFSFSWGQPGLLPCNCLEPWVKPFFTTTYSIKVKDKNGCEAKDLVRVILNRETAVYVPNAFSPNNDNINDFFTIYAGPAVRRVKTLMIFDRWGEKMFEQRNFPPNVEQLGWDGRRQGRAMLPGIFTYWAEIELVDGATELLKGEVTLLR